MRLVICQQAEAFDPYSIPVLSIDRPDVFQAMIAQNVEHSQPQTPVFLF
jgi:hypothetical protein